MLILAIETSCDETSVAIVEDGTKILSNVISSSQSLHEKTGGIIPEIAAREQVRFIIPVLSLALKQSNNITINNINALAVTIGPGLIGSLLVGVETAKTLALLTGKPLIPVNHIFAHIYANWLSEKQPRFPAIALVVSGGHTELFYMENHANIKWIGGTRDDAAGECFDKTARLMDLGYPGGPAITQSASKYAISHRQPITHNSQPITKLPRPMIGSRDYYFSFSGLKTAVLREVNKLKTNGQFNHLTIQQLSYEIQESITDVLVRKTLDAARKYNAKSILVGGGVAANQRLKEKFLSHLSNLQPITHNPQLFIPPPSLCTDNAAYIASFAYFHNNPANWTDIQARPDLEVEV